MYFQGRAPWFPALTTTASAISIRDRGAAWSNMGRLERGATDWERYLTEFPDAADHEQVRGQLRRVRQKLAQLN